MAEPTTAATETTQPTTAIDSRQADVSNTTHASFTEELVNPFNKQKYKVDDASPPTEEKKETKEEPKDKGLFDLPEDMEKEQAKTKERAAKRESKYNELKQRKAELETELKKAAAEKDELSKKLILREAEQLKREKRAADFDAFISEAEGKVFDLENYKDQLKAYAKGFKANPAIDRALSSVSNPHGVLEALMTYMDEKGYQPDALTKMNERQISLTMRNIDRELKDINNTKPTPSQPKEIPAAVIASTTKEDFVPEVKEVKNRKDALSHFAKYGSKGFKVE